MKNINDITLFRFLYNLDNRDLPQSIIRWYSANCHMLTEGRKNALERLYELRTNCRKMVSLSKSFVDAMDKSCQAMAKFHKRIVAEMEGESGVIVAPHFVDGMYEVYQIKNEKIHIWTFLENIDRHISIPMYYILAGPSDGKKYTYDYNIVHMNDYAHDVNLEDYIYMVLDYLCLREWAEVEICEISTRGKKVIKNGKKEQIVNIDGLPYYTFDSRWYTEICNNNQFKVSGHLRLQPYGDGSKRLIWISEFIKNGYHRKASIEKYKDGKLMLD